MNALATIRTILADAAATVDGVQGYSYLPPQVNPPCVLVSPDSITYNVDLDGDASYRLPLQVLVSMGDWESANRQMDALIAHDGALVAAIEGSSLEAQVVEMAEYTLVTFNETSDYLGAVLTVEVLTS